MISGGLADVMGALGLLAILAGFVAGLGFLARRRPWDRIFNILPVPFWCYMLPMMAATAGWLPTASPLHGFLSKWALPICLTWLLLGVNVRAMAGLGRPVAVMMVAGFAGIVLGAVAAAFLLRPWLPAEAWKSLGALAASWTGGSANMLAVKEALSAPESIFAPVVLTDGLFSYGWMSLLMAVAGRQARFDAWTQASSEWERSFTTSSSRTGTPSPAIATLLVGALGASAGVFVSGKLPSFGGALTPAAWAVLLSTTGGLCAATILSRAGRGVSERVEKSGHFLLLVLVASLGARATVSAALNSPVFLAAGLVMLSVHGVLLLSAAKAARAPLALAASTSQCCIGGAVSGPMVAAVYRPALAAPALLMAIAANALGTYVGLFTASLCRWVMK